MVRKCRTTATHIRGIRDCRGHYRNVAVKKIQMPTKKFTTVKDLKGRVYKAGTSKIADEWLNKLGITEREYIIKYFNKTYIVDGIDSKKHIVMEFLGETYHGSHKAFPKNRDTIIAYLGKTPNQLYIGTLSRFINLTSLGWKVFFVWESDYKKGMLGRYFRGKDDNLY